MGTRARYVLDACNLASMHSSKVLEVRRKLHKFRLILLHVEAKLCQQFHPHDIRWLVRAGGFPDRHRPQRGLDVVITSSIYAQHSSCTQDICSAGEAKEEEKLELLHIYRVPCKVQRLQYRSPK